MAVPLKAVLDTLDGVEESLRGLYTVKEEDGATKFYLDLEGVDDHPSITGLKNSRDSLLREKKTTNDKLKIAETKLATIPDDFDPEKWEQLKAEAEAREADPDNKEVHKQIEAATNAVRQQYETKIDNIKKQAGEEANNWKTKYEKEREFSQKNLVQSVITKALTEANIKPALMDAATLLLERRIEIIEEESEESGEEVRRVLMRPEYGGEDPAKFIQTWVQTDAGKEFVIPASGTGASGGNRHRTTEINPWAKETWNLTEQGRMVRQDRAKAERLAKAAGRSLPT
jgi:hypothetical protein